MRHRKTMITIMVAAAFSGLTFDIAQAGDHNAKTHSARWKIANAISAAPEALGREATVVDYPEKTGEPYPVLREGTNGWSCFPDYAPSPGNDPACYDKYGMQWLDAYYAGKEPHLASLGMIYRLRGGSDPSLTDPSATEPARGEHWVSHPPHVVIIPTGKLDAAAYGSDHHSGGTWVMWPGTPYEHLHLPVR